MRIKRVITGIKRQWRKLFRRGKTRNRLIVAGFVLLAVTVAYNHSMRQPTIDPSAYTPLLNTIAKGESNGNYNAHFGNVTNDTTRFTDMTIAEVLQWQVAYVEQGSPSSAVGKYQIVRRTLEGLVQQLGINPTTTRFDPQQQDRMAIALLERRGSQAYVQNELTREQFAANLAKEWAALPRVIGENPEDSYYAHDGLNKSRISIDEIYGALAALTSNK